MVYGAEAVLPADIAFRSAQVENFDEDKANEVRELEVNSAKEKRAQFLRTYSQIPSCFAQVLQ